MADDKVDAATGGGGVSDGSEVVQTIVGGDRDAITRSFADFYVENSLNFGAADIFLLDAATPAARAAMIAVNLHAFNEPGGKPVFRDYVVLAPPGTDLDGWLQDFWSQHEKSFAMLAGRALTEEEDIYLRSRIRFEVLPDMQTPTVVDMVSRQADRTAIIVGRAAVYRDHAVASFIAPGAGAPTLDEDFWAPQVHALAAQCVAAMKGRELYAVIDVGELVPRRAELLTLLESIDECAVMGGTSEDSAEHILSGRVDQWERWLQEGRVGRAIQDVNALPDKLDSQKGFLRAQLLSRAGLAPQALALIEEELRTQKDLDPYSRTKLARIAENANASRLATQLLQPAIDKLEKREHLATALGVACDIGDPELENLVIARIDALFPGDANVARRRLYRLVEDGDYAGASRHAVDAMGDETKASFYAALDRHLSGANTPDYASLTAEGGDDMALTEAYRMVAAEDARRRSLLVHAFDLSMPLPLSDNQIERGERVLLLILKDIALFAGRQGDWPIEKSRLEDALLALLRRLADDPTKAWIRVGLAKLFDPAISGSEGRFLLVAMILRLAGRPVTPAKTPQRGSKDMVWLLDKKSAVTSLFEWIKTEEPAVIGRLVLPAERLPEPADDLLSGLASYLDFTPFGGVGDEGGFIPFLLLASAIAPHTADPDYDLELLRLVAGKFASGGAPQAARDLVEQALLNSASSERRRRLAWFAVADTYARAPNLVEASLALACTWLASDKAEYEQIFQETILLARLLREFGLLDPSLDVARRARDILDKLTLRDAYEFQVDTLELQIRHRMLRSADDASTIAELLVGAVRNAQKTLEKNALPDPVAAMLGQLIRQGKAAGAAIPPNAEDMFEALVERTRGSSRALLTLMAAAEPQARDLAAIVGGAAAARYSDDAAFDLRNIAIVASRALSNDAVLQRPEEVSYLLDLGADHGVALPDWDEAAIPPSLPAKLEDTARIATEFSKAGISVVQAGFDENGRLVRVAAVDGILQPVIREEDAIFSELRLREWSKKYPFDYGIKETTANLFYTTTADLRFSTLPEGPTLLVAEAGLQTFPPNLLFVDEEFAGRRRPMAAAPSLAWLDGARKTGAIGDGRLCSWLSTAVGDESQTLVMIADRLEHCFAEHGFMVDNGPKLPGNFAGSSLAVITAHGGINSEGRYFQMVSDEGELRVSSGDMANALRNVGVVILFVCSGGRADKHPGANTTLGLAKQILDRGCTAVIASPWPLDSRVPSHWLPVFLDKWRGGDRLIEACHAANLAVDQKFAMDPARGLAMTLFGNPEILAP